MQRNLGRVDRILRFFLGAFLIAAPLANIPPVWANLPAAAISIILGGVLLITSMIKFCPIYRVFDLSTCKT